MSFFSSAPALKEEKTDQITSTPSRQADVPSNLAPPHLLMVPRILGHAGKVRRSNLRTRLIAIPTVYVGAAATAITINTIVVATPGTFPEITAFGSLFDEMRLVEAVHDFTPFCSTSATVPGLVYGSCSVLFDVLQANLTTTYGAQESEFNTGLIPVWTSTLVNDGSTMRRHRIRAKPGKSLAPIANNPPGSQWFPISSLPNIFTLAGFFAAPSAAGIISVLSQSQIEVEFRQRL